MHKLEVTASEFVPRVTNFYLQTLISNFVPQQVSEPAYKMKQKTEICKFWLKEPYICPYGDNCAFAHGEHELVKKKHVAPQFRMTLCKAFT